MWRHSGQNLRILWLVLAVWLLLPCCCSWADVVLTDEEATLLKQSLMRADEQLAKAQNELKISDEKLQKAEQRLERAEKESAELQKELRAQEERFGQLSTSWKQQKKEARWGKAKAFCIGALVGVAGGLAGGYYLTR